MNKIVENILMALEGRREIIISDETGLIFWWNFNHTVNIYRISDFKEIDVITFAFDKEKPTDFDFRDAVENYLTDDGE